jgi:hypothetical protein
MATREKCRVLTSAVITAERPVKCDVDIKTLDRDFEIEVAELLWGTNPISDMATPQIEKAWKLRKLVRELNEQEGLHSTGHRRPNPMARSMCRNGRRYKICKDHGTTARRKEIAAINAAIEDGKPSEYSVRGKRKARKHAARSGHPRYKASRD